MPTSGPTPPPTAPSTSPPLPPGPLQSTFAALYPEIKRVAHARLVHSGGVVGLNTTALVHEGFLRLADQQALRGSSRGEFFAYVGQVLRSVVIDYLRAHCRDKRGGEQVMVTLSAAADVHAVQTPAIDLIAMDRALTRMRDIDSDLYELIEAQVFAGLSVEELATLRGVTTRTIHRDVVKARALLSELLG